MKGSEHATDYPFRIADDTVAWAPCIALGSLEAGALFRVVS